MKSKDWRLDRMNIQIILNSTLTKRNIFVIDPPIQNNNSEFVSNQDLGKSNFMDCIIHVIEAESNKLVNP